MNDECPNTCWVGVTGVRVTAVWVRIWVRVTAVTPLWVGIGVRVTAVWVGIGVLQFQK